MLTATSARAVLCRLDAGGAGVGGQAQAGRNHPPGIEYTALDWRAGGRWPALLAWGAELLCRLRARKWRRHKIVLARKLDCGVALLRHADRLHEICCLPAVEQMVEK